MNAPASIAAQAVAADRRNLSFQRQTGRSLFFWALVALLNLVAQIIFHRKLGPGEFGTLNTALGIIALMTVPVFALQQGLTDYLAREHPTERREFLASLRGASFILVETAAWAWAALAAVIMILLVPHLGLPRWSTSVFTFFNALIAIGGVTSAALYPDASRRRLWGTLLLAAILVRVLLGAYLSSRQHRAEAVLIAFLVSGFIVLLPLIIRETMEWSARLNLCRVARDRDFLLQVGATFSVVVALFLFTNADRIVAQGWFGDTTKYNLGYIDWPTFDSYQTAGLLGRALIWGTQPLLLLFYAQRSPLLHTTRASLFYFWIYMGALIAGAILLGIFSGPASALFCGDDNKLTSEMVPAFALIMVPIGLLQALGVFALASRRLPECFVLGGCGLGYFLLLFLFGRQPSLMLSYMLGGAAASILILLFIGIVRWGRKQP
jgi:hypothetical protein